MSYSPAPYMPPRSICEDCERLTRERDRLQEALDIIGSGAFSTADAAASFARAALEGGKP